MGASLVGRAAKEPEQDLAPGTAHSHVCLVEESESHSWSPWPACVRDSRNGWERVLEGTELRACVRHTQQPVTENVNGGMQKEAGEVLQHSVGVVK